MKNAAAFFASVRSSLFGNSLSKKQVDGINAILAEAEHRGTNREHLAYLLATVFHETQQAMTPNEENLNYTTAKRIRQVWPSRFPTEAHALPYVRNPRGLANKVYNGRMGNRPRSDDGWNYRGRGLPHLTGRDNYGKASQVVGVDLVTNPDMALELPIAVRVLFDGMERGWFTGHDLYDHIDGVDESDAEDLREYTNARRIVNGTDKAATIGKLALRFESALKAGGYVADAPFVPPPPDVAPIPETPPTDAPERQDSHWLTALAGLVAAAVAGAVAWFKMG